MIFRPVLFPILFTVRVRKVLPVIRPITYQYNNKQAGYLFIEVSTDLFTVPLKDYSCPSMTAYLYLYDCRITLIYMKTNGLREFTPEYSLSQDMSTLFPHRSTTQISRIHSANKGRTDSGHNPFGYARLLLKPEHIPRRAYESGHFISWESSPAF